MGRENGGEGGERVSRKQILQYCMVGTLVLFLLGASETTGIDKYHSTRRIRLFRRTGHKTERHIAHSFEVKVFFSHKLNIYPFMDRPRANDHSTAGDSPSVSLGWVEFGEYQRPNYSPCDLRKSTYRKDSKL